jgi:hypothetical protein
VNEAQHTRTYRRITGSTDVCLIGEAREASARGPLDGRKTVDFWDAYGLRLRQL